jgi:hypothetical protein
MKAILAAATLAFLTALLAPSPAKAAGTCEAYADQLTPQELRGYSDGLRWPLPARYALLLDKVEVRNDSDPGRIAPAADIPIDGSRASILVPRGFRRLSCRLLQVAAGQAANLLADMPPATEAFDGCIRQGAGRRTCLERVLVERTAKLDARFEGNSEYAEAMRSWVESAFRFVLAHEAAHIVLDRARKGPALLDRMGNEVAADLQAALALAAFHDGDIYPAYVQFAAWSLIDPTVDWSREIHAPMACRASTVASIFQDVLPRIKLMAWWAHDPEGFDKYRGRVRYPIGAVAVFRTAARCDDPAADPVRRVRADLDRLLAAADSTRKLTPAEEVKSLDAILAVPLQTEEIRGVRATSVAARGYRFLANDIGEVVAKDMEKIDEDDGLLEKIGAAARVKAKLERTLAAVRQRIDDELDARLLSGDSYARFIAGNEVIRRGVGPSSGASRIEGKIRFVEQYAPGSAVIPFLRGIQAFRRRDCEAGRRHFREAIRIEPGYEERLDDLDLDLELDDEPLDREDCQEISRLFR